MAPILRSINAAVTPISSIKKDLVGFSIITFEKMKIPTAFSKEELLFFDSLAEESFEFERVADRDSITCYVPYRGKLQELIEDVADNVSYPFNLFLDVAFTYSETRRDEKSKSHQNSSFE